jgi:hypothetical protein
VSRASEVVWTVYRGETRGEKEPVSFRHIGDFPVKREAVQAVMRMLGGKKPVNGILRTGHSFFAIPSRSA